MSVALYRKYRSAAFKDVIGQEHITKTLQNSIKNKRISHAYLFTGPHGVGKTSVARIFAHQINGLKYDSQQATQLDIIEIDAASNRRIDEIRELRDKVNIAPVSNQYKVYIIDEVHMLTNEAFNALLKTLEEPPSHVIFILATTEARKLPETIISRTQRHNFKPISPKAIKVHLGQIAKQEKINVTDEAVDLIATVSEGSARDAISLLDQVASLKDDKIDLSDVEQAIGYAPKQLMSEISEAIERQDTAVTTLLQTAFTQGIAAPQLSLQLIRHYRSTQPDASRLQFMEQLLEVATSLQPEIALEIAILKMISQSQTLNVAVPEPIPNETTEEAPISKQPPAPEPSQPEPTRVVPDDSSLEPTAASPVKPDDKELTDIDKQAWDAVLEQIKKVSNPLYALLRMSQAKQSGDTIYITFKFGFHHKRATHKDNLGSINQVIRGALEGIERIEMAIDKDLDITTPIKSEPTMSIEDNTYSSPTESVISVMGGGEVIALEEI